MSKEDSNQNDDTEDKDSLKHQDGDDSDDASEQEVSDEAFLARINQEEGKDFKSIEDWKDSRENLENALKDKGRKVKKEPKEPVVPQAHPVVKSLYFDKHPEAKAYWDTVEKEAKNLGKDPFELYESSDYMKGEAKKLAEVKKEEEANKKRVSSPSQKADSGDKYANMSKEDAMNLSPEEYEKWSDIQASKG